MAAIGRVYNQAFERSPAGTLAVTNGFLSGVADIVAQSAQMGVSFDRCLLLLCHLHPSFSVCRLRRGYLITISSMNWYLSLMTDMIHNVAGLPGVSKPTQT
jgi:hypothetical protein